MENSLKENAYQPTLRETEDGSHTLFVPELNETYHSGKGAITESKYVFIEKGLYQFLPERPEINILEVGLGTGLNALLTYFEAEEHQKTINYFTLEPFPLSLATIAELNYADLTEKANAKTIFHQIHEAPFNQWVSVGSYFKLKKVNKGLEQAVIPKGQHVVYFDAFAPGKQPEVWEKALLEKLYICMQAGGVFVTFSAKGAVRRNLEECGFRVERLEGPPGKREMLRALKKAAKGV